MMKKLNHKTNKVAAMEYMIKLQLTHQWTEV
jgi:hypothetical protein